MARKKLKVPAFIEQERQDEFASVLRRRDSERATIAACSRIPCSPEAYSLLTERVGTLLGAQRDLDCSTASSMACYEEELHSLRAQVRNLERENKGLLIELRKSMRIEEKKVETEQANGTATESGNTRRRKRGAPPGHRGASRPVPPRIDGEKLVQPPARCDCGCSRIVPLNTSDDKYIEDIRPVVKTVTKVRYLMGKCAGCGKVLRHEKGVSGPPVATGPNIGALLTMMRQYGMTYGALSKLCTEILDIPVTRSGVLGIVNRSTDRMEPIYDMIGNHLPKEPVLNGDETGWKVRGNSGYIWILCSRKAVYFHHDRSRAGAVLEGILGDDHKGIVVCDFYGGYNVIKNTQRCLGHFLKDIKKQCEIYKGSKSLRKFKEDVKAFIKDGLKVQGMKESPGKIREMQRLGKKLDVLGKARLPRGEPETLAKRIRNHKDQMMLFIAHPEVEYHNNRAERHLRPMVISRKNSFGSDTDAGAERTCVLQSVVETCKLNSIPPYEFIRKAIGTEPENILNDLRLPL